MAIATISQAIARGQLSIGYAANDNAKGALFSPRKAAPGSPVSIALITDSLNWGNAGGAQTDVDLREMANYLIWLCGMYGQQAQATLEGAGGGTVTPLPSGGDFPQPLDFIVANDTIMVAGDITLNLDGSGGRPDFRGYNVEFARNGQPQYTTDPQDGSTYFGWNRTTGVFSLFGAPPDLGAAQLTERFRISPSR